MSAAFLADQPKFNQLNALKDRAQMLATCRHFFAQRSITEVDTPLLQKGACIDAYIDLFSVETPQGVQWLHSSPEYAMKRLLCEGMGDIYQIGHVFRYGEEGKRHRPEFTMAEWYRLHTDIDLLIEETAEFVSLFLGKRPLCIHRYHQLFIDHLQLNILEIDHITLLKQLLERFDDLQKAVDETTPFDTLLEQLFNRCIEPHLGQDRYDVVIDWPASQAALAQVLPSSSFNLPVAKRFELFADGNELANGYLELRCPSEHRHRFSQANKKRISAGKAALPIDESFIKKLSETPLPPCCGVAVGFDRLMMLRHRREDISEVICSDK